MCYYIAMKLFRRKPQANYDEIHNYVQDIESIYHLRNKAVQAGNVKEAEEFTNALDVMEIVLVRLNERLV